MTEDLDTSGSATEDSEVAEPARSTAGSRVVVLLAAALAMLLVGAAAGMLITLTTVKQENIPDANSVDVGFAQDMTTHHLQAVTMASMERDATQSKELRVLAYDIESTQTGQAGQMSGWLALWGQPETGSGKHMKWMAGPGGHAHNGQAMTPDGVDRMPGMATTDELTKLRQLTGDAKDTFFVQLMLRHHEGGLEMAEYARDHASQDAVRTLASAIVRAQNGEIVTMKDMLIERGAPPLPVN